MGKQEKCRVTKIMKYPIEETYDSELKNINVNTSLEEAFRTNLGDSFCLKNKYIVCLQGPTSSGKSTMAHNIYQTLLKSGVNVFLLEMDRFYKKVDLGSVDMSRYDFDNPGSIDWDKINRLMKALHDDEEFLELYEYSFITKESAGPIITPNPKPNVIIIEGIYSFNTINNHIFNIKEFDPIETEKEILNEFIENQDNFNKFNKIMIKLNICKEKSYNARLARDVLQRGRTKESVNIQFHKNVWPATIKWVNNRLFKPDIEIIHGNFNLKKTSFFINEITRFFTGKGCKVENDLIYGDFAKQAGNICTKECISFIVPGSMVLYDLENEVIE